MAIADMIAKGKDGAKAPHTKAFAGVTADQAKDRGFRQGLEVS
jgi:hypothetical protein